MGILQKLQKLQKIGALALLLPTIHAFMGPALPMQLVCPLFLLLLAGQQNTSLPAPQLHPKCVEDGEN